MDKKIQLTTKSSILFAALFAFLLVTQACKKSPKDNPYNEEFVKANSWVTEQMRFWYFWNTEIPANGSLNFNLKPEDFFEIIRNKEDRFSWIDKVDNLKEDLAGISTTTGINFGVVRDGGNEVKDNDPVIGYIRYVVPESPAEQAGVERGMFFTKVNGKAMTVSNYNSVLDPYYKGEGFGLQLAKLENDEFKPTIQVQLAATKVNEPSVHYHKIINTVSGKKVGYLFYNRFLDNDTEKLFDAFQEFKDNGIEDLILDVRYNLGGGIAVSGLLSALIMQNYDENDIYVGYQYNDELNEFFDAIDSEFRTEKFVDIFSLEWKEKLTTTKLNLSKVYVLATYNSASASELVINNLRPYMNVVHIGDTTRGKNEGSITLEDERKPRQIDWAIQPIVLKLTNANHFGDYSEGLVPNIAVKEGYELKPLGDKEDPLVKAALAQIDPSMAARARSTSFEAVSMFKAIKNFDDINNKARPVLVDKKFRKELLK